MTSRCEAGESNAAACAWCGRPLESGTCFSVELEASVHPECLEILAAVCAWCGWPLDLAGNPYAAELGGPVHGKCYEVLVQAREAQDLARRDRSDWQDDLVKLWRQALKDREKREKRDREAWRRAQPRSSARPGDQTSPSP